MPHFLSAMKQGVQLNAGDSVVLTVNLQSALDWCGAPLPGTNRESEDIVWTLRSSRSTQPVLRLVDTSQKSEQARTMLGPDYSGYFQLYSKSVENVLRYDGRHGLSVFGNDAPGSANQGPTSTGSTTIRRCCRGELGASYDFAPAKHHKAELGVDVRQGALFADPLQTDPSREVQVRYGEDFQWSDHLVFNYGAEAGRAGTVAVTNYLRPRFGSLPGSSIANDADGHDVVAGSGWTG